MSGFELLERMQADAALRDMPVVVFTGKELSGEEEARLKLRGEERRAQGRAVARAAVRRNRALPPSRRRGPAGAEAAACSSGCTARTTCSRQRKVLVVDDDARNIFALTTVLENQEMEVRQRHQRPAGDRADQSRRPT